jgi:hypothetical protein
VAGPYLLKANDQSGSCLNCHQAADVAPSSYHISTAGVNPYDSTTPVEMTPGGDFAWRHGHNIIAGDFGYVADSTLATAPGGTYPASALGCQSCHDPHGRYRRFSDGTYATTGLPIFNSGSYIADASNVAIYDPSTTENKINQGYSVQQQQNAYYGRPATRFGPYARSYCNKCHAKD